MRKQPFERVSEALRRYITVPHIIKPELCVLVLFSELIIHDLGLPDRSDYTPIGQKTSNILNILINLSNL